MFTPGKSIFAVPLNDTPPIVRAVSSAVAAADNATAMFAVPSKDVPPMVRAVCKAVAVAALPLVLPELPEQSPVTFPVSGPANPVAVNTPVEALYVRFDASVIIARLPVALSKNAGKAVVSDESATVTVEARVAVAALPTKAPVNVVAVTVLSLTNTESIVTPAAAVVSSIVSVVIFWLADTMMFVEPVVFPFASTSASVSTVPTCAST